LSQTIWEARERTDLQFLAFPRSIETKSFSRAKSSRTGWIATQARLDRKEISLTNPAKKQF
jgi:hypothetical protein